MNIDLPTHESEQLQLERLVHDFHQLRAQRRKAYAELQRAHHITLSKLALAAEYKDNDTGVHILRVGRLSRLLAEALGQAHDWCVRLELAAPMHDIGKIGVPDHILNKPAALDADERARMQLHTVHGAEILGGTDVPVLQMAAEIALNHHEKWDGSGYPRGLEGTQIPCSARIVAVIDFIDALSMNRCYRPALPDSEVLDMLRAASGEHFDPHIAEQAIAIYPRLASARDAINRGEG